MNRILIIGAGGHAKAVADTILLQGKYTIAGFLDDKVPKDQVVFRNLRCIGSASEFPKDADAFVAAIGNNPIRKKIFECYCARYEGAVILHPLASVSPEAVIGKGTVVLAGAVVAQGAQVGENCILNSLSLVDHETKVGKSRCTYTHRTGLHYRQQLCDPRPLQHSARRTC
jgi:acetyltransferase EpsM